ncbi:MAG: hypothetical protein KIT11_01025 [Fimbriimonadaceae bacterium]|nr:hypothetical protein [Fimbriimonadaceae bacterium]QYK55044.1 MAG: hypothetical protein KF733_08510 [Fimbriimonadaceae bacterium]
MNLNTCFRSLRAAMAVALACSAGSALAVTWYSQPWTPPRASTLSVVANIGGVPFPTKAYDDFVIAAPQILRKVEFWGTLPVGSVVRFELSFYQNLNCKVGARTYTTAIYPQKTPVGMDCQGRTVYHFLANTSPVVVPAGKWYVSIAEDDSTSSIVGLAQFGWSGRRPLTGCPAWLEKPGPAFDYVKDACDGNRNDLAFLFGN